MLNCIIYVMVCQLSSRHTNWRLSGLVMWSSNSTHEQNSSDAWLGRRAEGLIRLLILVYLSWSDSLSFLSLTAVDRLCVAGLYLSWFTQMSLQCAFLFLSVSAHLLALRGGEEEPSALRSQRAPLDGKVRSRRSSWPQSLSVFTKKLCKDVYVWLPVYCPCQRCFLRGGKGGSVSSKTVWENILQILQV